MPGLTVLNVRNAKAGRHADGNGLYLLVSDTGARSWMLRVQVDLKRRDIGLGSVDLGGKREDDAGAAAALPILSRKILTLAEAREKADLLRRIAKAGKNPVTERDRERVSLPTFTEAAKACHADLKDGWAPKNGKAFLSCLEVHAFPSLGGVRVDQVEASHIRDMLAPIWLRIPETARKVQMRVGVVLNYSKAKGWRTAEVPGRSVTVGLARRPTGGNFAAMPYADTPAFVASLNEKTATVGRLALLFTIHTAARSGEVRSSRWSHIDLEKSLWNRPAELMKSKAAHTVTLTAAALALLEGAQKFRITDDADPLIFPSSKNKPLSDMTLSKIMRDAKVPFTVHGFRSTFRDFAAEQMPSIPDAVAEAALAHAVPDKVERAYKRTQFLEMRRTLLDGWCNHIAGKSNVLRLAIG